MNHDAGAAEEEYVLVFDSPDQQTAEVVCATLQAAGLRAVVEKTAAWRSTYFGNTLGRSVFVPASEAETARSVLADQVMTEDEIAVEMEADGITLEEAEARIK